MAGELDARLDEMICILKQMVAKSQQQQFGSPECYPQVKFQNSWCDPAYCYPQGQFQEPIYAPPCNYLQEEFQYPFHDPHHSQEEFHQPWSDPPQFLVDLAKQIEVNQAQYQQLRHEASPNLQESQDLVNHATADALEIDVQEDCDIPNVDLGIDDSVDIGKLAIDAKIDVVAALEADMNVDAATELIPNVVNESSEEFLTSDSPNLLSDFSAFSDMIDEPVNCKLSVYAGTEEISNVDGAPTMEISLFDSQPLGLKLKPPSKQLKDIYAADNTKLPMLIANNLSPDQKERWLQVLKKHKEGIGWTVEGFPDLPDMLIMEEPFMKYPPKPPDLEFVFYYTTLSFALISGRTQPAKRKPPKLYIVTRHAEGAEKQFGGAKLYGKVIEPKPPDLWIIAVVPQDYELPLNARPPPDPGDGDFIALRGFMPLLVLS